MINEDLIVEFGKRIKQLRLEKKLSQEELSFATGFHRTYIGMIESGERNISLSNMAVFAKVFEISLSELIDFRFVNPNHSFQEYKIKLEK